MAGLDYNGFLPKSYEDIKKDVETRLDVFNPGFDHSPESPDGQLNSIYAVLLTQIWVELGKLYDSYNPNIATGQALRNIGLISGIERDAATYGTASIALDGVNGTQIPAGSEALDADGNKFTTDFSGSLPFSTTVTCTMAGPLPLPAGTISAVGTNIQGWTTVVQAAEGVSGKSAVTESNYRNTRNRTVLRNYVGTVDTIEARLVELGIETANIANNTSTTTNLPDGTPPLTVHVTVGETGTVTNTQIADTILNTLSMGTPTYGAITVPVKDSQGVSHDIKFSKAVPVDIFIDLEVTFLDEDIGGAETDIRNALITHINALPAGDDVIWSRLFALITPYAKAQVNVLDIGKSLVTLAPNNVVLDIDEYADIDAGSIQITVV